jgi:hypothetical protein
MRKAPDENDTPELRTMVEQIRMAAGRYWERWDDIDREEIYHYTSLGSGEKIFESRTLWGSDILTMNDMSEFRYSVEVLHRVVMDLWGCLPVGFSQWFDPSGLLLLGQTWNMFAACFCSSGDLLSQWRGYADNAAGVSIGFRTHRFDQQGRESQKFALVKIHYPPEELQDAATELCREALRLRPNTLVGEEIEHFWGEVALVLYESSLRFKNPDFREECEWRTLSLLPFEQPIEHRVCNRTDIGFIRVAFSPDTISRVILGPRFPDGSETALRRTLDTNGFENVLIQRSEITLRK